MTLNSISLKWVAWNLTSILFVRNEFELINLPHSSIRLSPVSGTNCLYSLTQVLIRLSSSSIAFVLLDISALKV